MPTLEHSCDMFARVLLLLLLVKVSSPRESKCSDYVPHDYDSLEPPALPTKQGVRVTFDSVIRGINEINEPGSYFEVPMYIFLNWVDWRLLEPKKSNHTYRDNKYIRKEDHNCFWKPTYLIEPVNEGELMDNGMIKPVMRINYTNKQFTYYLRYHLKVQCAMNLVKYPMDVQKCSVYVVPWPPEFLMEFEWRRNARFKNGHANTAKFMVTEMTRGICKGRTKFSCIKIDFKFERRLMLSLITVYFPSALIVLISFVSFWLDCQSVPGRVSLVITSLLTLMTQLLNVRSNLPAISYITALDIWFFVCVTFISAVLFEFALAYNFFRKKEDMERNQLCGPVIAGKLQLPFGKSTAFNDMFLKPSKPQKYISAIVSTDLDKTSKLAFPLAFLLFLIVYWTYYLLFA